MSKPPQVIAIKEERLAGVGPHCRACRSASNSLADCAKALHSSFNSSTPTVCDD